MCFKLLIKSLAEQFFYYFQKWIQWSVTSIGGTSSSAQCSMVVEVSVHLWSPGDSCLTGSNGRCGRVFPRLGWVSLGQGLWLLGWLCVGQGLLCQVVWASLFCCSIRPSSAGTWTFCLKLHPWPRLSISRLMLVIPTSTEITVLVT